MDYTMCDWGPCYYKKKRARLELDVWWALRSDCNGRFRLRLVLRQREKSTYKNMG